MKSHNQKPTTIYANIVEKTTNPNECYEYLQESIINFSKLDKDERLTFLERLISYGLYHYNLDSIALEIKPIKSSRNSETKAQHFKGIIQTQPYLFSDPMSLTDDISSVIHELDHENVDKNINAYRFKSLSNPKAPSKIMAFDPQYYDYNINLPLFLKINILANKLTPSTVTEQYKYARYFLNEKEIMARKNSIEFTHKLFSDTLNSLKSQTSSFKNYRQIKNIEGDLALINANIETETKKIEMYQELIDKSQEFIKPSLDRFRCKAIDSIKNKSLTTQTHFQMLSSLQEGFDDDTKAFMDRYYSELVNSIYSPFALTLLNHPMYPATEEQLVDCLSKQFDISFLIGHLNNYSPDDIKYLKERASERKENLSNNNPNENTLDQIVDRINSKKVSDLNIQDTNIKPTEFVEKDFKESESSQDDFTI